MESSGILGRQLKFFGGFNGNANANEFGAGWDG
jgi:hypothetical protein